MVSVRAFADSKGGPEQAKPNSQIPEGMDWEMWCGPAPLRPFNTKLHPGGWRNFLDYANGTMGDCPPRRTVGVTSALARPLSRWLRRRSR